MTLLRYGNDASVTLELADGAAPVEFGTPEAEPLGDVRAATLEALNAPLDYPPLARCTTPADRVVIAVDHGAAHVAEVVAAVIDVLLGAHIDPEAICVLQAPDAAVHDVEDPCRLVDPEARGQVQRLVHNPDDRQQLAYLAANDAAEPIMLARAIHDADLVIPIGCLRAEKTAGYFGIHSAVFPTFSDLKTIRRFRALGSLRSRGGSRTKLIEEVEQVAWLLGLMFTVQLVPAAGSSLLHVLAGESEAVRRRGRRLYQQAWQVATSEQSGLVVAAIEGRREQQTWENLGRALHNATALVDDGGVIAVCCDLAEQPGPAMRRIAKSAEPETALKKIGKQRPLDALPAAQLAAALARSRVYLFSRLEAALVEDLEMVPVANADELARLVRRCTDGIFLSNADRAVVRVGASAAVGRNAR